MSKIEEAREELSEFAKTVHELSQGPRKKRLEKKVTRMFEELDRLEEPTEEDEEEEDDEEETLGRSYTFTRTAARRLAR